MSHGACALVAALAACSSPGTAVPDASAPADAVAVVDATTDTPLVDRGTVNPPDVPPAVDVPLPPIDAPLPLDAPQPPIDTPPPVDAPPPPIDVPALPPDVPALPPDVPAPPPDVPPAVFAIPRRVPTGAVEAPVVSASATIGPSGGTLSFGRAFSLRVPAGALASPVTLTVGVSARDVNVADRALSTVYSLGPSGTTFAVPAEVSITAAIDAAPDAVGLALRSDSGATEHLTVTRAGTVYTGRIPHFSEPYIERTGPEVPLAASTCARTPAPPPPPLFTLFAREGVARSFVRPAYVRSTATGFDVSVYAAVDATDDIRFRHFDDTGTPATPSPRAVTSNVFARVRGGDFAAHPDGGSVVVYGSNQVGGAEIWARRVTADGTPMGPAVRLSNDPLISEEPRIAATADGFMVAWRSTDEARNVTSIEAVALDRSLAVGPQVQVAAGDPVANITPGYFEVVSTGPFAAVAYVWQVRSAQGLRLRRLLTNGSLYGDPIDAVPVPVGVMTSSVSYAISATHAGDDAVLAWTSVNAPAGLRTMRVSLLTGLPDTRYAYGALGNLSLAGIAPDGPGFVVGYQFVNTTDAANPLHTGMVRLDTFRTPRELPLDVGVHGTASYPVAVAARPGGRYAVAWMYAGTRDTTAMTWDDPSTLQFVRCP